MLLKLTRDLPPGTASLDQGAPCESQCLPADGVVEQRHDCTRKVLRFVGHDKLAARCHCQPFRADGRRNDGLGHRQRFENLQPCAASGSERDDIHRRLVDMRTNVVHGSGDGDAGALGDFSQP